MTIDRHSNLLSGSGMGSWSLTVAHTAAIVVSSGVVAVEGKDDDATADFSLRYEWLKEQIKLKPEASEYQMSKYSPITLSKACSQNKLDCLGEIESITKSVDIKYELKRCYRNPPSSGKELIGGVFRSEPWDISVVANKGVE